MSLLQFTTYDIPNYAFIYTTNVMRRHEQECASLCGNLMKTFITKYCDVLPESQNVGVDWLNTYPPQRSDRRTKTE
jgi:hypothetical protein